MSSHFRVRICVPLATAVLLALFFPALAADDPAPCHVAAAAAPLTEEWSELRIPDTALVDQNGQPVHFYSDLIQDRIVAINFIYTTCTTICPPMAATFARLQQELQGRDVHLISVTLDPVTDTPQRLKEWSTKFRAQPGWTLVTGEKAEVDHLLKALGVFAPNKEEHSPIILAGNDAAGQWTRASGLAPPAKLRELLERLGEAPIRTAISERSGR